MRQRNIKDLDKRIEENSRTLVEDPRAAKGHWHEVFGNANPIYLEIGCGKGAFITAHATAEPEKNFIACEGQSSVVLRALEKAEETGLTNLRIFIDYVHDLSDYFEAGELAGIYLNFSDPWPKARHAKRRLTYHKRLENYKSILPADGFIEFKTDNDGLFEFTLGEIELMGYEIEELSRDLHGASGRGADGERAGAEDAGAKGAGGERVRTELTEDEGTCGCGHAAAACTCDAGEAAGAALACDGNPGGERNAAARLDSANYMTEYEQKFASQGKNINFVRF